MTYSGYDMSPRKLQILSENLWDVVPDAPNQTRRGKTTTTQNDSKAPFKVIDREALTLND